MFPYIRELTQLDGMGARVIHIGIFLPFYFCNVDDIILDKRGEYSSLVQKRVVNGHITLFDKVLLLEFLLVNNYE